MLGSTLFWYGKLPNHPEFLSANTNTALQNLFQSWIVTGQNHIGQSLMGNQRTTVLYGYGFLLHNSYPAPKLGVLLTSHDSVGRSYPFILAQDATIDVAVFINEIQEFFNQQSFDFHAFYPSFDSARFFSQLQHTLTDLQSVYTYHAQNKRDYWIECYPTANSIKLTTEQLTPILYRKLMLRGN